MLQVSRCLRRGAVWAGWLLAAVAAQGADGSTLFSEDFEKPIGRRWQ